MSSPLAKLNKTKADRLLIGVHRKVSHSTRIDILSHSLSEYIRVLTNGSQARSVRVLDVGCGDMSMAEKIEGLLPYVNVVRADIHAAPSGDDLDVDKWKSYVQFNGIDLPFDHQEFEVAYFSDVLHHVPEELRAGLFLSAAKVAKYIVVKDHFEYGWLSRQMLRLMDLVGNYGYGVSVPVRYFNSNSFETFWRDCGLTLVKMDVGIDLYQHLPIVRVLIRPRWQFFAVFESPFSWLECEGNQAFIGASV